LIVEDEVYNYYYLLYSIQTHTNAEVTWAKNGLDAIKECEYSEFDLILMDINLPGMNGFEVTCKLKKKYPNIPIVAQTAYILNIHKEKIYKCGILDILEKPIKMNKLLEIFSKYL
jgi:CheY-like chemotaxis protein